MGSRARSWTHARPVCVEAVRAADFLLGHDEWGARWIAAHRAKLAAAQAAGAT